MWTGPRGRSSCAPDSIPADIRSCAGLQRAHTRRPHPFLPLPRAAQPVFPELSCPFPFSISCSALHSTNDKPPRRAKHTRFPALYDSTHAAKCQGKYVISRQSRAVAWLPARLAGFFRGRCPFCSIKMEIPVSPICKAQDSRTHPKTRPCNHQPRHAQEPCARQGATRHAGAAKTSPQ